jgi:DNA polymerase elongation subunit (family B)
MSRYESAPRRVLSVLTPVVVKVAKKKMARGEIVNSNDRIETVILQDPPGSKATPEWSRAEVLAYAVANKKQVDMMHYILTYETPITNLLASMVPVNVVEYIFKRAVR